MRKADKERRINSLVLLSIVSLILGFLSQQSISFTFLGGIIIIQFLLSFKSLEKTIGSNFYVILYFWIITMSTLLSGIVLEDAFSRAIQVIIYCVMMLYPNFLLNKYDENYIFSGMETIANVIWITALFGIYEGLLKSNILIHLFRTDIVLYMDGLPGYRVCSLYLQPVICAHVFLIPILYFINQKTGGFWKYLKIITLLIALLLTKSRSSWITLCFCQVVYSLKHFRRKLTVSKTKTLRQIGFLTILIFLAIKFSVVDFMIDRFNQFTESGTHSIIQRSGIIEFVLGESLKSNPFKLLFGHGHEASFYLLKNHVIYIKDFTTTDNEWISFLYNYGVITVFFAAGILLKAIKNYMISEDNRYESIYMLLIGSFINMMFWESLSNVFVRFLTFIILGTTLYLFKVSKKRVNTVNQPSKMKKSCWECVIKIQV